MTTDDKEILKARFAEARKLQDAGRDEEALSAYGKLIATNPNVAEVHFQVARLFIKNDRPDRAINHATVATALRPMVPDVWKLRADIVRTLSDPAESKKFQEQISSVKALDNRLKSELKSAVDLPQRSKPDLKSLPPERFYAVANVLAAQKWAEGEAAARSAIALYPDVGALHDALGVALSALGRDAEAEQSFKLALKFDPALAEIHGHYARLLLAMKKTDLAMRHVNASLRLTPGLASSLVVRGMIMKELDRLDFAITDYKRAIAIDAKHSDAVYALAGAYHEQKDYVALDDLMRDYVKKPDAEARLKSMAALAKSELGHAEEALQLLQSARRTSGDEQPTIDARIAELQQSLGDFEASEDAFERSIKGNPRRGETYRVYLTSKKIPVDDPLVAEMQKHWEDETISENSRGNFGFALAKVMEDNKQYDRVFEYLHPANAIFAKQATNEIERRRERQIRQHESFDTVDWKNVELTSKSDFAPIFVTGMPRSGTTLVEQIVSSHSKVSGAGEVAYAVRNALKLIARYDGPYRSLADVPVSELENLANGFRDYIGQVAEPNEHMTDKSINIFDYVGLLKMAMPRAKFVIVRRDPRDNLLSIYKNVFPNGGHLYSYNLSDCVACYRLFENSVNFWRERTPDWFYEIQYEDLVANPEEETRKLIDAVGLEWEDQCLEFHKNDRRVRTLSVYQVRQPMYKSSTKAWERYRDDLKELFDALGPEYMDAAE